MSLDSIRSVLVLGARGQTGRQVIASLNQRPDVRVRAGVRNLSTPTMPYPVLARFDWNDHATFAPAAQDIDAVYLVKPTDTLTNADGADPARAVSAFLSMSPRLKRIVLLSEIGAGSRPETSDERRVERLIETSGLDWTILRPNWFMQNFTDPAYYLGDLRERGEVAVPTGGQATSFVDTHDIGEVAVAALLDAGHAGRHYTLTGDKALTWREAISRIAAAARHDIKYIDPPLETYLRLHTEQNVAAHVLEHHRNVYETLRGEDGANVTSDIRQITGRAPRSFEAFVTENADLWKRGGA
ncbi:MULTISPECIES: NAD(P)H-binding protein [unclassified Mesorhizobium]|uniref:NAD(P)H-binding protein n=1 Tax=unclassified Mesorhizobium TaxID=325217 RepID=UPI0023AA1FC5|nr:MULTISPECIES: NAD(P)H-binding protein [unclassified Mesorhizobium]